MTDVMLYVAFGSRDRAVVWAGTYQTEEPPRPGQSTEIQLHSRPDMEDEDPESLLTEVVYAEEDEETGVTVVYLYAGETLPDERISQLFEASKWVSMGEPEARSIMELVDATPPLAHTHDVLLIVGDPDAKDGEGKRAPEAWNRVIVADDPVIPMFGERLYVDVLDALPLDDEDEEDGEGEGEDLDLEDADDEEPVLGVHLIADENVEGTGAYGLPAVVFYAAKVDPGEAQVGFWVSGLGDVSGFDLVAAGWQKMSPDQFDADEFRLSERVDLAKRTKIYTELDDDGQYVLKDYELLDAATVTESQYDLLPQALVNHCRAASEMMQIDDIVSGWVDEQDNSGR